MSFLDVVDRYMKGKEVKEIAEELNMSHESVEEIIEKFKNIDREDEYEFSVDKAKKIDYVSELSFLYAVQKKRLKVYLNLEKVAKVPISDVKDNILIMIKILDVLSKIEGRGSISLESLKMNLFGDEVDG